MRSRIGFAIFTAAVVLPVVSRADQAAGNGLATLRDTAAYRQSVFGMAQQTAVWVQNTCADAKAALGSGLDILQDPVFDD